MKYVLTFEAYSGAVKTDRTPYSYDWTGVDMTTSDVNKPWTYEKVPAQPRKPRDKKPELDAKKRILKKKSQEDRLNKITANIALNNDIKTFSRKTKTPGKAG